MMEKDALDSKQYSNKLLVKSIVPYRFAIDY
jgi:hypothetical protein